jgi:hypothetical protein
MRGTVEREVTHARKSFFSRTYYVKHAGRPDKIEHMALQGECNATSTSISTQKKVAIACAYRHEVRALSEKV